MKGVSTSMKPASVQRAPHRLVDLRAHEEVLLQRRPPQVEVAVLEAHRLARCRCRPRSGRAASPSARRSRGARPRPRSRRSAASGSRSPPREITLPSTPMQNSGRSSPARVCASALSSGPNTTWRDAVAVAQVDEDAAAVIAPAVHPAEEDDVRADVGVPELPAGVSALELGQEGGRCGGHAGLLNASRQGIQSRWGFAKAPATASF